ncbi:MAG TPA: ParB/RepB/Spo0J family partition protein [Chloroflexia bacterium]|nr:ParB/RepB/Spo0J family partition protein [Chloroflexia bacterium]
MTRQPPANNEPKKVAPRTAVPRLPGSNNRRDLKEIWGSIQAKTEQAESANTEARLVKLDRLQRNPDQPRRSFDEERDAELAEDVRVRGILEPLIVRAIGEDEDGTLYQIVAGERRFRAASAVQLERVPVIIKEYNDREARFTSLVENVQRVDLDPQDEARYFLTLIEEYNYSYRDIARMVNRSPAYVGERMKRLPGWKSGEEESNDPGGSANSSEINHKCLESEQKLQKSQSEDAVIRPLRRFRDYVDRTRVRLEKLKETERAQLAAEVKELREQLQLLEEELNVRSVTRETATRKRGTKK